jgi:hypothetical protein
LRPQFGGTRNSHSPTAEPLKLALNDLANWASANNHVRSAIEIGRNKIRDTQSVKSVLGIRIDNNVSPPV